jgi:hypothetical protein
MNKLSDPGPTLEQGLLTSGHYRDVLRDGTGRVIRDTGLRKNAIIHDFRRLLAAFAGGSPPAAGIQGLWVGAGAAAWDAVPPPPPDGTETALTDPNPFLVPLSDFAFDFLDGGSVTAQTTNRLQMVVTLGPGTPSWPDAGHASGNLREFGLVGRLDGLPVLLNCVRHPVIAKDPLSTLERTIWLVF